MPTGTRHCASAAKGTDGVGTTFAPVLRSLVAAAFALALLPGPSQAEPAHGFSVLGNLKYPKGFTHFDYVNPDAPRGGHLRLWYQGNFDNVNPFILKGQWAAGSNPFGTDGTVLTFATLMTVAADERASYYGYIAESVEQPDDRQSITFHLRPEARFHDGSEITAADVAWSFETLKTDGHPIFRISLADVESVETPAPRSVRFHFRQGAHTRDLPGIVAALPVLSKAYYENRNFNETTLTPPLGNGFYSLETVDEGRAVTYKRIENHWADTLPVGRGRWNFDRITWDYYRDRDIALEALFAGKLDFREDYTSRNWATKYDNVPAVQDGRLIREELADHSPSGFQAFYLNTRRDKFSDRRVRRALGMMFDFEWTNRNLFYGLYQRTYSTFQNSDMEAHGEPSAAELKLLEPWRDELPPEVFGPAFRPDKTDGSGNMRQQQRTALKLLKEAGWTVQNGALRNAQGEPFEVEFLSYSRLFERIIMPYVRNLERLGIKGSFRLVEPAQYQRRMIDYDFDITTFRLSLSTNPTTSLPSSVVPGVGLRQLWGSAGADEPGTRNYSGLKSPAVDALIEEVIAASSEAELLAATHALDRVVMWTHNVVPQWYKASHTIAYWDIFARPQIRPRFARGVLDTWWIDADKAARLQR